MQVLVIDEFDPPETYPDNLENFGLPQFAVRALRHSCIERLSQLDGMTHVEMLRLPNVNGRVVRAIREAQNRWNQATGVDGKT